MISVMDREADFFRSVRRAEEASGGGVAGASEAGPGAEAEAPGESGREKAGDRKQDPKRTLFGRMRSEPVRARFSPEGVPPESADQGQPAGGPAGTGGPAGDGRRGWPRWNCATRR